MALTKVEEKKLRSFNTRAQRIEKDARKLARDTGKELMRQMRKS